MSETANVTKPIQSALEKAGYFVMRLNSGLVKMGARRIRLCPKGTADLVLYAPAQLPLWIETKAVKGKTNREQLEAQGAFRERVEALGHQYVRATCLSDVLEILGRKA